MNTKPTAQFDHNVRVVSIDNLRAMCANQSGVCHTFTVDEPGRHTVKVWYSNPDEYGTSHQVAAVYPTYPAFGTIAVVMHPVNFILYGEDEEYIAQVFNNNIECATSFVWSPVDELWHRYEKHQP